MFRNKQIRRFIIVFTIITLISTVVGFVIDYKTGIFVLVLAAAYGAAFFAFTRKRYQDISNITEKIDLVLHNEDQIFIEEFSEGELSILEDEITKMTQRIREQNDHLGKEKVHLADSMADIAHQLRTPLTSANLILSLLQKETDETKRRELLRENKALFAKMDWLVTSLLKLSRLDAGVIQFKSDQIQVDKLLQTSIEPLLIPMELHDITLLTKVSEGSSFKGDFGWSCEVIQNIVKNCMESTGDHGKIEIGCEDNTLYTEITIHDNGEGFDKEEIHHLFERFYRGKNSGTTGYGIGLALSKSIIKRQGGTIKAKNHPKGGAIFIIRFPK